jgi:hypothetical protein
MAIDSLRQFQYCKCTMTDTQQCCACNFYISFQENHRYDDISNKSPRFTLLYISFNVLQQYANMRITNFPYYLHTITLQRIIDISVYNISQPYTKYNCVSAAAHYKIILSNINKFINKFISTYNYYYFSAINYRESAVLNNAYISSNCRKLPIANTSDYVPYSIIEWPSIYGNTYATYSDYVYFSLFCANLPRLLTGTVISMRPVNCRNVPYNAKITFM